MGKYVHNKTRTNKKATKENLKIINLSKCKEQLHTSPFFKILSSLPLADINNEAIALFMFRYYHHIEWFLDH